MNRRTKHFRFTSKKGPEIAISLSSSFEYRVKNFMPRPFLDTALSGCTFHMHVIGTTKVRGCDLSSHFQFRSEVTGTAFPSLLVEEGKDKSVQTWVHAESKAR